MSIAFQFLRLDLWWVPVAALALWLLFWLHDLRRRRRSLAWLGARQPWLSEAASGSLRPFRRACFGLGLLLAGTAALGPSFGGTEAEPDDAAVDIVVCLDVSRSMLAADQAPDRLRFAKAAITRLAEAAGGDRIGLVLFAGEARRWVPLTADGPAFIEMLDPVEPALVMTGGTDLAAPLALAREMFDGQRVDAPQVVLVTDGEDNAGSGRAEAERLRERGIFVHAVGMGTTRGGKIPLPRAAGGTGFLTDRQGREVVTRLADADLKALVAAGGGDYIAAADREEPLLALYEDAIRPRAVTTSRAASGSRRRDDYPWLLIPAWLLLALHLTLTDRRR